MSEQLTIEKPAPYWTEEREQALIKAWNEGSNLRALATSWDVSIGAICGKIKRLKRAKKIPDRQPNRGPQKRFARPTQRPRPCAATTRTERIDVTPQLQVIERQEQPFVEPVPEPIENIIPIFRRCSLLQLEDDKCHWPIGDPREPDFFFCGGEAVTGLPYCGYHARLAYPPREGRR